VNVVWGIVVMAIALLAWVGQGLAWLVPRAAERWSLTEREDSVDPAYHADGRGEAVWDAMTLWTLVVAGLLLAADHRSWPYFGLVGGGMYLYFAGRGILTRLALQRHGHRIGTATNVRIGYLFLTIWGLTAATMIVAATVTLTRA
jgi:hypothetical protein